MKKRKKYLTSRAPQSAIEKLIFFISSQLILLLLASHPLVNSILMLKTNCLTNTPGCECSWNTQGKFISDCSHLNLSQVPQNDYSDYLYNSSGNNQMPTLNRDIQQLNLASNNLTSLEAQAFHKRKFRNLQKLFINRNQLGQISGQAFYKLTGLIELDLSENLLAELADSNSSSYSGSSEVDTFLRDLNQLRQLSLASNKLTRLEAFAFRSLIQLRQLDLSR